MWYLVDGVLILKEIVCPGFTLMAVPKPWMVESPEPLTCQSLVGSPGCVFSQAITLTTGGPHGPAAAAGLALMRMSEPSNATSATLVARRRTEVGHAKKPMPDILAPHPAYALLAPR